MVGAAILPWVAHANGWRWSLAIAGALTAAAVVPLVLAPADAAVRERDRLEDYRGLFTTRPAMAAVLSIMLLSLAGVPLTGGFLGKVYVFLAGIGAGLWWQTGCLVLASTIGLVYYLRIIAVMAAAPKAAEGGACAVPVA